MSATSNKIVDKKGFVTLVKKKRNRKPKAPMTMNPLDWELMTDTEQRVYTILKSRFGALDGGGLSDKQILAALNKGHADVRFDFVLEDVWDALDKKESPLIKYTFRLDSYLWTLKAAAKC